MKTALCTIAFKELPVEQVLDLAREHGLDGVEIWGKEPHMGETYDADRVAKLKDAVAERGLDISAFGSYVKPEMDDFDALSQAALDIAVGLGADVMRIWSGGGASAHVTPEAYALAVERLKDLCLRAADVGVTLAFEFHDNSICDNARGIVRLIEDVGSPVLKTYYQPSRREGADDPYEAAEIVGPYVVNVHAQNYVIGGQPRVTTADGDVDYRRVVPILQEHGFDGYLEIEFVDDDDKMAALAADAAFLRELAGR